MPKIGITIPQEFLREVDKSAKNEQLTRSEFFRKAVLKYWEMQNLEREDQVITRNIKEAMQTQANLRKKAGTLDGVAKIRRARETR